MHLPLDLLSFSSFHLSIHLTYMLHCVLTAVSLAALCRAVQETSPLISLEASTWVTPGPREIGIR